MVDCYVPFQNLGQQPIEAGTPIIEGPEVRIFPQKDIAPGAHEMVDGATHYGGKDNPYEHRKVMVAIGMDRDAFLYNCTKYLWRLGRKPGADVLQDLKKARQYLDFRIEEEEKNQAPKAKTTG